MGDLALWEVMSLLEYVQTVLVVEHLVTVELWVVCSLMVEVEWNRGVPGPAVQDGPDHLQELLGVEWWLANDRC